jgi:putative membrane protein
MKKEHLVLGAINGVYLAGFAWKFLAQRNFEFVIYVGVVLAALIWIGLTLRRVDYSLSTLIGLTVWGIMHMAGGGVPVGAGRLYDVILIPLSASLPILRYDQVVHLWGFGVCTLLCYDLLRPQLGSPGNLPFSLGLVLVMAGLGFGAFNEILEFLVMCVVPQAGVGGYENTALDLCANMMGAIFAWVWIRMGSRT